MAGEAGACETDIARYGRGENARLDMVPSWLNTLSNTAKPQIIPASYRGHVDGAYMVGRSIKLEMYTWCLHSANAAEK